MIRTNLIFLNRSMKTIRASREKVSILDDVDFCIELIESDHINVAYIMNLIKSIDINNLNKRQKQIKYISELLEKSSNPELYKKVDLIRSFLELIEDGLEPGQDIDDIYESFIERERQKDIEAFISESGVDRELLTKYISEYEFSSIIDEGAIRDAITEPMGLLKKKTHVRKIVDFIKLFTEKYI